MFLSESCLNPSPCCSLMYGMPHALQVSHHPPICAAHAENENFQYDLVSAPTTRFLGNSLEVFPYGTKLAKRVTTRVTYSPGFSLMLCRSQASEPVLYSYGVILYVMQGPLSRPPPPCYAGRTRITLRSTGEVYTLVPPNAMVHNIVIGRTWVDAFGPLTLTCPATGSKCVLNFTPCGWFGYGRHEFSGFVVDKGEWTCVPTHVQHQGLLLCT